MRVLEDGVVKAYFEETNFAVEGMGRLFDFAWPTAAALWNLRWQVRGFVDEVPSATQNELLGRFTAGSEIVGMDLRKSCIDTTWDEQKSIFAGFILTNAFAVYEHWSDKILLAVGETPPRSNHPLQIDQANRGVQVWIAGKQASLSSLNDTQFYPHFHSGKKYSWALVDNLMKAYRYFKQARNALIHRGGIADAADQAVYADFAPVSTRAALGMNGDLEHEPLVAGQSVRLHLRGTVGFCDILIRLMRSIDAELCRSKVCEAITQDRLRTARGLRAVLSTGQQRRNEQVLKICRNAGLPRPSDPDVVFKFMRDRGILQA